jgi:hypothetical protein
MGCRILVFTPYNDQVVNIFMKLENFLRRNSDIAGMVKRYVKNPYFMEFTNGSWIMGKPAGTKSNAGASSSRGWGADRYLIDEGDFLADPDYATFMPMLTEHGQTRLSIISTPTGKRQKFYHLSNDNHYKEFHVPCYRRPDWSKQVEEEARAECPTELDFVHEMEADWGVAASGVFNVEYVKDSLSDYTYYSDINNNALPSYVYNEDWIYCIGADLNEVFGLAAVVIGWNPEDDYFWVVDREGVEITDYTQIAGMELIRTLNSRWNPKFIYLDKKPSKTSFEVLKRYGMEQASLKSGVNNPDSRLGYIIKQFDFGSKIEVPDLTGRLTKRTVKPFMIGIGVRRFEERQIKIPRTDKDLFQQLVDFTQKVNPSGNVQYIKSSQGDHWLDAFLLGVLAFALEFSELGGRSKSIGVAFGPSFGKSLDSVNMTEQNVIQRTIHFVPTQRQNAFNNMRSRMHVVNNRHDNDNRRIRKNAIKKDLRRN